MLNFPVAGGTSGHFLGAALAAILLGPWLACLVMAVVLSAQAFVFADGGITALGANILNMGMLGALLAGLMLAAGPGAAEARGVPSWRRSAVVSWLAVMAGALATRSSSRLSGTVPLETVLPAMLGVHALIGVGEAVDHGRGGQRGAGDEARPDRGRASQAPPSRGARAGRAGGLVMTHRSRSRRRARRRGRARDRRLAVRLRLARTAWSAWPTDKAFLDRAASTRPGGRRRSPTTRSRASTTSASRPGSPASWARWRVRARLRARVRSLRRRRRPPAAGAWAGSATTRSS